MPDEITYLFTVFPLTLGLPGLVKLGKVYEFKGQLFNPGEGDSNTQILVYLHIARGAC